MTRPRALDAANAIAPEHLELMCADADVLVPLVRNAGAVFVGAYAPAVLGDYVAGTNHVLPTGGTARFASALRIADFQKHIHVVRADAARARPGRSRGPVHGRGRRSLRARRLDPHARGAGVVSDETIRARRPQPRDDLQELSGYHSPQVEVDVRLNTNESPYPPPRRLRRAVGSTALRDVDWNRYPDRAASELRDRPRWVPRPGSPARLLCGNGSNEMLQTLLLTYGGTGRRALMFEPTYALHAQIARGTGTEVVTGERLGDYRIDPRRCGRGDRAHATVGRVRVQPQQPHRHRRTARDG